MTLCTTFLGRKRGEGEGDRGERAKGERGGVRQERMIEKEVRREKRRRENGRKIMFTHLPHLATKLSFC